MGGSKHSMKKNTEALVVTSKEIGLEVNANETKYMVTSRDQNSGKKNHNINLGNKYFEMVE
jgi:hypothetical protein